MAKEPTPPPSRSVRVNQGVSPKPTTAVKPPPPPPPPKKQGERFRCMATPHSKILMEKKWILANIEHKFSTRHLPCLDRRTVLRLHHSMAWNGGMNGCEGSRANGKKLYY